MPQVEHHPKASKEEDPAQIKRFRADPIVKRAKDAFQERLKKNVPMGEAQAIYDKDVAPVRKRLGFD